MPGVNKLLDQLGAAQYIMTLYLTKGYWKILLSLESKEKTAFVAPCGLYQFWAMPFRLHGTLATFQSLRDCILQPYQENITYLDDGLQPDMGKAPWPCGCSVAVTPGSESNIKVD